jgi:UDP-N-acetyl-D-mannosaminuronic acid dehydrogenase
VNDHKPEVVIAKVLKAANKFRAPKVACLGLAFKPDIDDLRASPAMDITEKLADALGAGLMAVEPNISELPKSLASKGVVMCDTAQALEEADILVLLVDHKPFKRIPRARVAEKVVIDTRGAWR